MTFMVSSKIQQTLINIIQAGLDEQCKIKIEVSSKFPDIKTFRYVVIKKNNFILVPKQEDYSFSISVLSPSLEEAEEISDWIVNRLFSGISDDLSVKSIELVGEFDHQWPEYTAIMLEIVIRKNVL